MNALNILRKDHKVMFQLIDQIEHAAAKKTKGLSDLFKEFKLQFSLHDEAEDNIIYPNFLKNKELKPLILKGYQAHHMVEISLLELRLVPFNSETWLPKFLVLKDSLLSHAKEEEKLLFPTASKFFKEDMLIKLGKKILDSRA